MSLDEIVKYLDNIEALANYKKVKKRNKELIDAYSKQKERAQGLEAEVERLENLRISYGGKEYSLDEFQKFVEESVEDWKINQLQARFDDKWVDEKDALVEMALKHYIENYPNCPSYVQNIVKVKAKEQSDNILRHEHLWPDWLKAKIDADAEKRANQKLDDQFDRDVQAGVNSRVYELEREKWPSYVHEKASPFLRTHLMDQFTALSQGITSTCPKCGTECLVDLDYENMRVLFSSGKVKVTCCNIDCHGFLGSRTSYNITFADVIRQKLLPDSYKKPKKAKVISITPFSEEDAPRYISVKKVEEEKDPDKKK
ncbi:hypothetical protein E4H04_10940 [Candidatus Bathyarchaeota archaeon]|nr:MAG: hypothetical protein E4H04_10940 [Candidatus Bathyarchaeota archaeon]